MKSLHYLCVTKAKNMTLTNAIKKAEKITGAKATIKGQHRYFEYKGFVLSFAQNGRYDEAANFYTRRKGQEDDLMTDYFAGTFHDNLTQAIDFINRY